MLASAKVVEINGRAYLISNFLDITARKRRELTLRQSTELYRNLTRSLPETSVLLFDHDFRYILAEGPNLRANGFIPEEMEGKTIWEVLPPKDCDNLIPNYQAALNGIEHSFESEYEDKVYLVRATPIKDEHGHIFAGMLLSQDVTILKKLQLQIQAEKEQLDVTLRSIGDAVISTDLNGNVTLLNQVAEQMTGWSQTEAIGNQIEEVFHIIHSKTGETLLNPVRETLGKKQTKLLTLQATLVSRDRARYNISASYAPIRNSLNQIIGTVLVFRDDTHQQRLNDAMLMSNKLSALGVLAGGIAHDFNNLLIGIISNIELAKLEKPADLKIDILLDEALQAALRSKEIAAQLLTFAKGGAPIKKMAQLTQIVSDSTNFVLRGSNVTATLDMSSNLWMTEIDSIQISQVMQNLVINAMQAMPNGGKVLVHSENVLLNAGDIAELPAGRYVCLTIQDSGEGITPEDLDKIFDPYFTTKSNGSGLGLAVCYSIIKKHDGIITLESQVGEGTTFRIYLPALFESTPPENEKARPPELLRGNSRILIMDDEETVRKALLRSSRHLGYEAEVAHNGEQALELYKTAFEQGEPFSLVLLDLTVPGGMGGLQTLTQLREIDPQVQAIVCSGYSNDEVIANYSRYGFVAVLHKPFKLEELSETLHRFTANSNSPGEGTFL